MATEIVMPQMGAEMEEGTLIRWLKKPGEYVKRGDIVAEIETDKATVDLESFEEGYFLGGVIPEGTKVPVGTVIGYLGAQGEPLPGASPAAAPAAREAETPAEAPPPSPAAARPAAEAAPVEAAAQAPPAPALTTGPSEPSPRPSGTPLPHAGEGLGVRAGEGPPAAPPERAAPAPPPPPAAREPVIPADGRAAARTPTMTPPPPGARLRVSPVARSIAEELGIDLRQVRGSGPEGRIMRRDVEEYARAHGLLREAPAAVPPPPGPPPPPPPPAEAPAPARAVPAAAAPAPAPPPPAVEPLSRMRQAIARRMAAAKREMPHYYVTMSVDMTAAQTFRRQLNAALPEEAQLTVTDLILKACALALERHPRFNWAYTDEGLRRRDAINIGIAVALEDGLVAPAVLNCQGKSLGALAREAHDLVQRARGGRLRPAELSEGTFTISNLGMYGVETLIAIIQPDQSAILGVGAVEPRPVVRDGQVVVREMMTVALSADHRVTDGAEGARFLAEIKDLLEHPERLVL
jgi:pyruvate dehydrogenase E2 component (dihydrolipoamide acetyltransferase)